MEFDVIQEMEYSYRTAQDCIKKAGRLPSGTWNEIAQLCCDIRTRYKKSYLNYEERVLANCKDETAEEYHRLLDICGTGDGECYNKIALILLKASNETQEVEHPDAPACQTILLSYRSPSVLWASYAVAAHYYPALGTLSMLLENTAQDVKADLDSARSLLMTGALAGDVNAQLRLASEFGRKKPLYNFSVLFEKNTVLAKFWYEKVAEQDVVATYRRLARDYYVGILNDYRSAALLYRKLIDNNEIDCYVNAIDCFYSLGDIDSCHKMAREALKISSIEVLKRINYIFESENYIRISNKILEIELAKRIREVSKDKADYVTLIRKYNRYEEYELTRSHIYLLCEEANSDELQRAYRELREKVFTGEKFIEEELYILRKMETENVEYAKKILEVEFRRSIFRNWKRKKRSVELAMS